MRVGVVSVDLLTVSETAKEPPQDEEGNNCPQSLAIEATYVNQNFSQQMLLVRKCIYSVLPRSSQVVYSVLPGSSQVAYSVLPGSSQVVYSVLPKEFTSGV